MQAQQLWLKGMPLSDQPVPLWAAARRGGKNKDLGPLARSRARCRAEEVGRLLRASISLAVKREPGALLLSPECHEVAGFGTPSIGMVAAKLPCWLLPGWGSVHGSCTNSVTLGAAPHPPSWLRFSPFTQRKRSAERLSNLPRSKRKERRDRSPTPITVQPASSQRGSTWNTRGVTRDLGLSQSWRSPGADTAPGAAERHRLPGRFRWASQIPSHRPRPLSVVF